MKKFKRVCSATLALVFGVLLVACNKKEGSSYLNGGEFVTNAEYAVTVDQLRDADPDQERWLSIPDSELVLNPFPFSSYTDRAVSQTSLFNSNKHSLNIGILDPDKVKKLENVISLASFNAYGGNMFANSFDTAWRPDRLEYTATYDTGLEVEAYDYFYDENTIVRNITHNNKGLVVWGGFASANANSIKLENETLALRNSDGVTISIAFSTEGVWRFYNNEADFVEFEGDMPTPMQVGVWSFTPNCEGVVSVAIAINKYGDNTDDVIARANQPFASNNFVAKAGERADEWNKLLAKIPSPSTFKLPDEFYIDVDESKVESYYYRSWSMVINGTLSANRRFEYRTLSLGKASMWSYGSTESKYSCIWESLFGTQMYSFLDADIAWELALGNMAIIPEDGNIRGESLPSNKAHTIWVCYTAKQDKEKLSQCVEPLENYLNWRFDNPRWILDGAHNNIYEKDIDFAGPYLVDLKFMIRICEELELADKAAYWQAKADEMYQNITEWFFPSTGNPMQLYFTNNQTRSSGTPLWISKTLFVDQIEGTTLTRARLVRRVKRVACAFCQLRCR